MLIYTPQHESFQIQARKMQIICECNNYKWMLSEASQFYYMLIHQNIL